MSKPFSPFPSRHLVSLSNVSGSCVTAGEWTVVRQRVSVHLSLPHSIIVNWKWKSISYAVTNGAPPLISLPLYLLFAFSLFHNSSKRPEDWEESIFVRHKECGYRLRDNVHFHMYISTSPCGDGRLNSPYEITSDCKTPCLSALIVPWRLIMLKIEKN